MKFKLKRLNFSGQKAAFYTVVIDGSSIAFKNFLDENMDNFQPELSRMLVKLNLMANKHGALDEFFKLNESSDDDEKVVAYYDDPEKHLRVYCVRMSEQLVVLGGGGQKKKGIIKWQHDRKLRKEAELIMSVSKLIDSRIENGHLGISADGLFFIGNLELN